MLTHQQISWIKSGMRIAGYTCVWRLYDFLHIATGLAFIAAFLIGAEVLGIIEEIGHGSD